MREKRPADALREAELYIKAKPTDAKGHVLTCDALYDQKNYQRALTECQQAERQDQVNGTIKGKIGRIYLGMKNYQSARDLPRAGGGRRRRRRGSKDPEMLGALAEAYAAVRAPKDKLNSIGDELASLNKDPRALATAGQVYFLAGNDERAMSALDASLAIEPNNAGARAGLVKVLNRRAGVAIEKNETGNAYSLLSEAIKMSPDDLMTNRNLGLVLLLAKKYSEAEQVLQRSLRKVPNDMVVNRMLARAQLGQRKTTAAQATYEKAAQMALRTRGPDLAAVYAELGPMYAEDGRVDQAVSVLETAVKEAGQSPLVPVGAAQPVDRVLQARAGQAARSQAGRRGARGHGAGGQGAQGHADDEGVGGGLVRRGDRGPQGQQDPAGGGRVGRGGQDRRRQRLHLPSALRQAGHQVLRRVHAVSRRGQPATKREGAVKLFTQLVSKATGGTADWLRALLRSGYELLGLRFLSAQRREARGADAQASASKVQAKGDKRELEHNLAVIDLFSGKAAQAEKMFDALGTRPCEALVNLGILRDRQGESKKALDLYKQAKACGARAPKLGEWIDVKERLFGGGQ